MGIEDDFKKNADEITTPKEDPSPMTRTGEEEPYPHPAGDLNKSTPAPGPS